ncbi:hypothetical protein QNI19_21105 [Cytophagaceae bacterium DM2B3-1]|uniref:Outer membrane protein beta-barrel domain-containing protein n=1 Tax=Xanthocytophaga flava TaxID=3048013 RepID=A0ABT7CNY4_9BACT|nr:hypothetical protein [Xanthocytophaga flavus]MDJ1495451.1 hypothetical protein [Xanthocytophaga flavus]
MNASEKNSFEEQWRDAFENAELPPDPLIWSTIETKLADAERDKYKRRLYLFKLRAAASVTLLILATGAWTIWQSMKGNSIAIVTHYEKEIQNPSSGQVSSKSQVPSESFEKKNFNADSMQSVIARKSESNTSNEIVSQHSSTPSLQPADKSQSPSTITNIISKDAIANSTLAERQDPVSYQHRESGWAKDQLSLSSSSIEKLSQGQEKSVATNIPSPSTKQKKTLRTSNTEDNIAYESSQTKNKSTKTTGRNTAKSAVTDYGINPGNEENYISAIQPQANNTITAIEPISGLPVHTQMAKAVVKDIRWKLNQDFWDQLTAQDLAAQQKKHTHRARWRLDGGATPGSFNPNFNSTNYSAMNSYADQALNSTTAVKNSSVSSSSKDIGNMTHSGTFYATGLQTEFALSERFSLQGGVQYTYSKSQIDVTQYTAFSNSSAIQPDFYELFGASSRSTPTYALAQNNISYRTSLSANEVQSLDNTYHYIGFPMRVLYKVLNRKVKASIGAGVSTDLFLKSQISSTENNIETLEFNRSQNSFYKNTIFSGLLSVKLDYAIDNKYSIYIEPSLRRTLSSTTTSSTLSSFPGWWGVGTGILYRF